MSEKRRTAWRRGKIGEALCLWSLRLRGWRILAHGYVVGRGSGAGEIDIIARRFGVVAFIEVKARPDWSRAAEALQPAQRRRLARAAEGFLATHPNLADLGVRFDVMLVAPGRWPRHLADAWRPEG